LAVGVAAHRAAQRRAALLSVKVETVRKRVPDNLVFEDSCFAGQTVPAGICEEVEIRREIRLAEEAVLQASCDKSAVASVRRPPSWAQIRASSRAGGNSWGGFPT